MTSTHTGPYFSESLLKDIRYKLTNNPDNKKDLVEYNIEFDKKINFINEIYDMLDTLNKSLESKITILENQDKVIINVSSNKKSIYSEVDLILMFFSATYYDCIVTVMANDNVSQMKIVDGYVTEPNVN